MQNFKTWFEKHSGTITTAIGLVFIAGMVWNSHQPAGGLNFEFFCLLVCVAVGWIAGMRASLVCALASGILLCVADAANSGVPLTKRTLFWNSIIRLAAFVASGLFSAGVARRMRTLNRTLEKRTARLRSEVAEHKETLVRMREALVYRLIGITEDFIDKKRAEEMLRTQTRALESMAEGVLMTDEEGVIRLTNPAADALLGYKRGELTNKPVALLSTDSDGHRKREFRAAMEDAKTHGTAAGEYVLKKKDGDQRLVEARSSTLSIADQFHVVTVVQDITGRLDLERQILEISDREQARIGQDIHDGLCQQLISVAFDANALEQSLTSQLHPEAAKARRICGLLDQAITESRRVARGLYPVRLETEGLGPALAELANLITERFNIQCSCQVSAPDLLCSMTTATHLYRVAQEAINNALKHGDAHHISIQLNEFDGGVELRIEDDGKGFADLPQRRSGMGLHIMNYRAHNMGGSFRVLKGDPNGTVISCRIPKKPEESNG